MRELNPDPEGPSFQQDEGGDGEIEIIEVVGLDEDSPPPSSSEVEEIEQSPDEIVLDFDEADAPPVKRGASAAQADELSPAVREAQERLIRLQADFDNFKKRVDRERGDHERTATGSLINRLLPVLDNFERAVSVGEQANGEGAFRDGVILIFRQLLDELRKEGLTAIDSLGQPFDPKVHEAVATDRCSELPSNTVVEELQRGYLLHSRLLRPALVKVCLDDAADDSGGTGGER